MPVEVNKVYKIDLQGPRRVSGDPFRVQYLNKNGTKGEAEIKGLGLLRIIAKSLGERLLRVERIDEACGTVKDYTDQFKALAEEPAAA